MSRKLTLEDFLARARTTHGERYDYSEVVYAGNQKPVKIRCAEHGVFLQGPANHFAGKGCGACGTEKTAKSRRLDPSDFVARVRALHGGSVLLDDETAYGGWDERVSVGCPEHGRYMALPAVLLRGARGCMACAIEVRGPERLTKEEFVERATALHAGKYSYERAAYAGFARNLEISCSDHGTFFQTPCNHMQGKGCPRCSGSQSKPEVALLEWIKRTLPGVEIQERRRGVIPPYELDIYIPSLQVAVEFNGLYWHSADKASDGEFRNKHLQKLQLCQEAGVRLIQVREDRWADRPEVCKSVIASALRLPSRRENARSCKIVELASIDATDFLMRHHLDGNAKASVNLGLSLDDELLAVMTFAKPRFASDADWELVRLASLPFVHVRGAASRLLAHFRARHRGQVTSYCNLEYGSGGVYGAIGMKLVSQSRPGYVWVKNGQRAYSRYQTQKHKLSALLPNFDPALSESENMFANGFRRYWDSGNLVFITPA